MLHSKCYSYKAVMTWWGGVVQDFAQAGEGGTRCRSLFKPPEECVLMRTGCHPARLWRLAGQQNHGFKGACLIAGKEQVLMLAVGRG